MVWFYMVNISSLVKKEFNCFCRRLCLLHWSPRTKVYINVAPGGYQLRRYIVLLFGHQWVLGAHDTHLVRTIL